MHRKTLSDVAPQFSLLQPAKILSSAIVDTDEFSPSREPTSDLGLSTNMSAEEAASITCLAASTNNVKSPDPDIANLFSSILLVGPASAHAIAACSTGSARTDLVGGGSLPYRLPPPPANLGNSNLHDRQGSARFKRHRRFGSWTSKLTFYHN
ncbi:unnamed protein product [Protopolystoma xenopodis]|uniref:Uncharacterized protein n=1 Tax=Protopolystoma xenopodis TaxID=117903 RepID=A0A3S5ALH0_9PLAT|nr:unnamed protein product [Protopolystoma xenopodis]